MKIRNILFLVFVAVYAISPLCGQNATISRGKRAVKQSTEDIQPQLTTADMEREYITWQKTYYRKLDLAQAANTPLAYPQPRSKEKNRNLFTLIFTLASEGKITLYEYLDGEEKFEAEYVLSFEDLLTRFGIDYKQAEDIPFLELKAYYIKEINYFNQANSHFGKSVVALCPILYQMGEYGEMPKPLFWVKYQDIAPYLTDLKSITPHNEAVRGTYDDFFRLGLYQGEIIKIQDFSGRSLVEQSRNTTELQHRQRVLETLTQELRRSLSLPDSTIQKSERTKRKRGRISEKGATPSSNPLAKRSARGLS